MSGAPITFKGQHLINLILGLAIIIFNLLFMQFSIYQIYFGLLLLYHF